MFRDNSGELGIDTCFDSSQQDRWIAINSQGLYKPFIPSYPWCYEIKVPPAQSGVKQTGTFSTTKPAQLRMQSTKKIAIIDYGMGNLRSVQKAIEHVGGAPVITSDPSMIANASKVILPGVGAFGDAMQELRSRGLVDVIREVTTKDIPFLGICLGLQLLFDEGEEFGPHAGLGILAGKAIRFRLPHELKVPHMGWNQVRSKQPNNPLDSNIPNDSYFYFVHSYYVVPEDPSCVWLESEYGHPFCAAVRRGNLFATQFHPEKSQELGLQLLKNFVELG